MNPIILISYDAKEKRLVVEGSVLHQTGLSKCESQFKPEHVMIERYALKLMLAAETGFAKPSEFCMMNEAAASCDVSKISTPMTHLYVGKKVKKMLEKAIVVTKLPSKN